MANEEFGEKSHEATPYRRQKAREEGNVVLSRDLTSAALLLAALLILWNLGGALATYFGKSLHLHLGGEAWLQTDASTVVQHLIQVTGGLALGLLPIFGLLVLAALVANFGQTGFLFLPDKVAIDFNRINPLSNVGRIFSMTGLVNLGFGMGKVVVVLVIAGWSLWNDRNRILVLPNESAPMIATSILSLSIWTSVKVASALIVLAIADYGWLWWKHEQDLKMSTQEMREEMKSQQGDPQVAQRRKQLQRQLVMNRLASTIPNADVVVTNPTELAIALKYDPEKMEAPMVLAKGAGVLAQRIRRLALESNIAIIERKELAQFLYKNVDVNNAVPAEQYAAVAEVIRYVYKLKGKKLPQTAAA